MTDGPMLPFSCLQCGKVMDDASSMESAIDKPDPGAVSVCLYCAATAFFDEQLQLREPTEIEWIELSSDAGYRRVKWAVELSILSRASGG